MEEKHCKWYNDEFCTNGDSPCVADYCPVVEYPELCKCREVDKDINARSKTEEKKLTDEEVLQVLKCCYMGDGCDDCPLNIKDMPCNTDMYSQINDMIHRLQSENELLKNDYLELDLECRELRTKNDEIEKQLADKKAEEGEIYEWAKKNIFFGK